MPIDFYSSIKKTSQWAFNSPLLNNLLGSSIFVSLLISFIMVLIIMIMYPAKSGSSITIVLKMFLYMFMSSLIVIFLHDGIIKYMFEEQMDTKKMDSMMMGTTIDDREKFALYNSDRNMVKPTLNVSGGEELDKSPDEKEDNIIINGDNFGTANVEVPDSPYIKKTVRIDTAPFVDDTIPIKGGSLRGQKPILKNRNPFNIKKL
jgi:hypothetical protein